MNRISSLLTVLLAAVIASSASAAVEIKFDFRGNGGIRSSYSFSSETVNVTARGFVVPELDDDDEDEAEPIAVAVHQNNRGLSVVNTTDDIDEDRNIWGRFGVDGYDGVEFVELEFSRQVTFDNLHFRSVGRFDTLGIELDGELVDLVETLGTDYIAQLPSAHSQVDLSSLGLTGQVLRLYANRYDAEDGSIALDDWQIKAIDVHHMPEPASVVIWSALGLGFVAYRRHRRRRAAQ